MAEAEGSTAAVLRAVLRAIVLLGSASLMCDSRRCRCVGHSVLPVSSDDKDVSGGRSAAVALNVCCDDSSSGVAEVGVVVGGKVERRAAWLGWPL